MGNERCRSTGVNNIPEETILRDVEKYYSLKAAVEMKHQLFGLVQKMDFYNTMLVALVFVASPIMPSTRLYAMVYGLTMYHRVWSSCTK